MKIVVLAGGTSTERDVSLVSGAKIYKALKDDDKEYGVTINHRDIGR